MFRFLNTSMCVELGHSCVRIAHPEHHNIWWDRSVIALYQNPQGNPSVLATGKDALEMQERVPKSIEIVHPFSEGVIQDFNAALLLLRHLMVEVQGRLLWMAPKVRMALHHDATKEEKQHYRSLLLKSGAQKVVLVDRSFAAAIGADIPTTEACGYMIVDIGATTTEISVLAFERVAQFSRIKIGGSAINVALMNYIAKHHQLEISVFEAERVKCEVIEAVYRKNDPKIVTIFGKNKQTGFPLRKEVSVWRLSRSIGPTIRLIANAIQSVLFKLPPELSADVMRNGIVLIGGGALLKELSQAISIVTQHPVIVPDRPQECVIRGVWHSPELELI